MVLTGKCKEDFIQYCKKYCCEYENTKRGEFFWFGNETDLLHKDCKSFLNALIIDFFDSVGILVDTNSFSKQTEQGTKLTFKSFVENEIVQVNHHFGCFDSRQEATTEAIKKANELYNTNNIH